MKLRHMTGWITMAGALCAALAGALPAQNAAGEDPDQRIRELEERLSAQQERLDALEARDKGGSSAGEDGPRVVAGFERNFFLRSEDDKFELRIGGWLQPRYFFETSSPGGPPDKSAFRFRRVRLDFQGHVLTRKLTWRIMSEHAQTSNLRVAFIDYAFDPALRLQVGQMTVPFQWHEFISPNQQHFAERALSGLQFGHVTSHDLGVMLHGVLMDKRLDYRAGIFGNGGRNTTTNNNTGHVLTSRLTFAALGALPKEETDQSFSEDIQLSFGVGAQGSFKNERRNWDLGRGTPANARGNFATLTADTRVAYQGFSLAADVYHRSVTPEAANVSTYDGWAYMISAGYYVIPKEVELVARLSQLRLDGEDRTTAREEWAVGVNLYHSGARWKTRINYVSDRDAATGRRTGIFLVEWHLQF